MNYLSNAFSLQMVAPGTTIYTEEIEHEAFSTAVKCGKCKIVSIIGHADMATVLTGILGFPVQQNRESITLSGVDTLYVAQLTGGRLPEGATTLPEGFEITFLRVHIETRTEVCKTWGAGSIYEGMETAAKKLAAEYGGEVSYVEDAYGNLNAEVHPSAEGGCLHASIHDN